MKLVIQGYRGCFHEEAASEFFKDDLEIVEARSFEVLARTLENDLSIDYGIMAVENSIAGSILQNYRILREFKFRIVGELFMAIHLQLMARKGVNMDKITEIHSHPMAIYQSLDFLSEFPNIKIVETEDTAGSAKYISEQNAKHIGAIASRSAASIYELEILGENIESSKTNYTRFLVIQNSRRALESDIFNKASIYFTVPHEAGSLLKCLSILDELGINMTKLQSYPLQGRLDKYYFYLDLEFENQMIYEQAVKQLNAVTEELEVLGVYRSGEYVH